MSITVALLATVQESGRRKRGRIRGKLHHLQLTDARAAEDGGGGAKPGQGLWSGLEGMEMPNLEGFVQVGCIEMAALYQT